MVTYPFYVCSSVRLLVKNSSALSTVFRCVNVPLSDGGSYIAELRASLAPSLPNMESIQLVIPGVTMLVPDAIAIYSNLGDFNDYRFTNHTLFLVMMAQLKGTGWGKIPHNLTHWGWGKMAAIFQMQFLNAFSWVKMYELRLKLHWSFSQGSNDNIPALLKHQAISVHSTHQIFIVLD